MITKRFCQFLVTSASTLRVIDENQLNAIFAKYGTEPPGLCHSIGAIAWGRMAWQMAYAAVAPQPNSAVTSPQPLTDQGRALAASIQQLTNLQAEHYKKESKRRRRHVDQDMPNRYDSDSSGGAASCGFRTCISPTKKTIPGRRPEHEMIQTADQVKRPKYATVPKRTLKQIQRVIPTASINPKCA